MQAEQSVSETAASGDSNLGQGKVESNQAAMAESEALETSLDKVSVPLIDIPPFTDTPTQEWENITPAAVEPPVDLPPKSTGEEVLPDVISSIPSESLSEEMEQAKQGQRDHNGEQTKHDDSISTETRPSESAGIDISPSIRADSIPPEQQQQASSDIGPSAKSSDNGIESPPEVVSTTESQMTEQIPGTTERQERSKVIPDTPEKAESQFIWFGDQPKPADDQPNTADNQPYTADNQPKPTDDQPNTADNRPKPADNQPKPTDNQPKPADNQPKPADDQTNTADNQPKPADDQPNTADNQPKPADDQPNTAGNQPKPADDQPNTADNQPKPTDDQSNPTNNQPKQSDDLPKPEDQHMAVDDQGKPPDSQHEQLGDQPKQPDDQPKALSDLQEPTTDQPKPAKNSESLTRASDEPKSEKNRIQSANEPPKPTNDPPKPANDQSKPANKPPKPVNDPSKPANDQLKPVNDPPKSANDSPKTTNDPPKPANDQPEPANDPPEPANAPPKPANDPPKPANDPPIPANDPPEPANDPPKPVNDSPEPANDPPKPANDPAKPANDPPIPAKDPPKPANIPPKSTSVPNQPQSVSNERPPANQSPLKDLPANLASQKVVEKSTETQHEITLYFTPGSYYSEKVLLALYERGLPFKRRVVNLREFEHLEPWYLALDPKGQVPLLQVGERVITESDVIINFIARLPGTQGSTLVCDSSSHPAQTIQRFRRLIDGVDIKLLTFGLVYHPSLSHGNIQMSRGVQQAMKVGASGKLAKLSTLSEKNPDQRDIYMRLIEEHAQRYESFNDAEAVTKEIELVGNVLTSVEKQLSKVKSENGTESEWWLCGPEFSAADISLTILLRRLMKLGLNKNFCMEDLPLLEDFFKRVSGRPSYQKLMKDFPGVRFDLSNILQTSKPVLPYVGGATAIGVALGAAYWVYKKVT